MWPIDAESLIELQRELARADPEPSRPARGEQRIGGCWVCFPRGPSGRGDAGDVAWAAAVVMCGGVILDWEVRRGVAGAPYSPGLLALRVGPLMDATVRALSTPPDVLLVDETAHDHPREADFEKMSRRVPSGVGKTRVIFSLGDGSEVSTSWRALPSVDNRSVDLEEPD